MDLFIFCRLFSKIVKDRISAPALQDLPFAGGGSTEMTGNDCKHEMFLKLEKASLKRNQSWGGGGGQLLEEFPRF